ncbi:hypothetical protein DWB85_08500 [Seongchinamella sediminis]|uniref:Uncharacterized protein n=1 Tax=Seongchinamella sediminis TaxID=2283635 RepID=A0A3L7E219_9GAMM|nr:hypothetical protein [Seongchinamella sediminis]RLQ22311.1 hypothetical protein DWB85_08500 [Seongchinamella sediminis]
MKRAQTGPEEGEVSEMAIVDTFTKLIFGADSQYSESEQLIIQAFRAVDYNVVFDSHRDMGAYLRALGVDEMIKLVGKVQVQLAEGEPVLAGPAVIPAEQPNALNRRVH